MNTRALMAAVGAIVFMASVPTLIKINAANEIEIATARLLIACLGMTLLLGVKKISLKLRKRQWLGLLLIGVTFAVHWFLYFKSIKLSTPSIAAIAVSTYGIHVLFLSAVFLKQKITYTDLIATVFAFGGMLLVIPEFNWSSELFWGAIIGVASGFLYGVLPVLHQLNNSLSNTLRAWGQFTFAFVAFLPFGLQQQWALQSNDVFGLIFLGVVSTLFAHSMWIKATTELPGVITGITYYLYIPLAVLISFLSIDEPITGSMILGALIIIVANVVLVINKWQSRLKAKAK